ncbi:MAG: hypothetical protein HY751_00395 [Nitrospinae bacterium]|nr:hypothetical protein [Nitrospinota bacterium]
MEELVLNNGVDENSVAAMVAGRNAVIIDCGVMDMNGEKLNGLMKAARAAGVTDFTLNNVCGQTLIGTGVSGPAKISVYGIMGNHSAAFIDKIQLNTYPTKFPNNVWCPGDAQVAIGNTSNPTELNIGGSVDDLFASYCPSGLFRVAGQGGNRCGLRAGAGIPHVWREIDYSSYEGLSKEETKETLLLTYQSRKARIMAHGWESFQQEYKQIVENRNPPVIVIGRRVRDYFMEYAQGTIGVILNVYDIPKPAGYYICSGMTAGHAYIRGGIEKEQLGARVKFGKPGDPDYEFLTGQINSFFETFKDRMSDTYMEKLNGFIDRFRKDPSTILGEFKKIIPETGAGH